MNRAIEGLIKSFGELTPERHAEKAGEFTLLYAREGLEGVDGQSLWETGKAGLAGVASVTLGSWGIQTVIAEYQRGDATGVTAGLLALAVGIKMAQTAVRTIDNANILLEVEITQHDNQLISTD